MIKKEKIAIIGTNGLPARYGGFETLVHFLTIHLKQEFNFVVYCSKTPKNKRIKTINDAKLLYIPLSANGWQSVIYDILSIIHAWFTVDKLLILGNSGALIFPFKFIFKKKIVLNIGGIDWARSKWNFFVKKFIHLSEWLCVKYSDVVITDNSYIQELYRFYYKVDSVLIEYGGDHVLSPQITNEAVRKYSFLKNKYVFSLARAQKDNNIHLLLKAFEYLPNYNLVIISNWFNSKYGKILYSQYKDKYDNIFILDAIYNQRELDMIRSNAWLYIHSHSFCGTAPSLVEAMNLGLPILCYDAQTNVETTENRSYYFKNADELIYLINNLNNSKITFLQKEMENIALKKYRWEIISKKYKNCLKD